MINIYQPSVGTEELNAIKQVFDSNWLGKGPKTDLFIKNISKKLVVDTFDGVGTVSVNENNLMTINSCTEGNLTIY